MANVWYTMLTRFKATTETLQTQDITLDSGEHLLESRRSHVASQSDQWEKYGKCRLRYFTRLYEEETI